MSRNKNVPEKSVIAFWDPVQMRTIARKEYDSSLLDESCYLDVDGDEIDELIVFWRDGRIEARNKGSAAMQRVFGLIDALAPTPTPVLITGENGTGKGLVAQALHRRRL